MDWQLDSEDLMTFLFINSFNEVKKMSIKWLRTYLYRPLPLPLPLPRPRQ